MISPARSDTHLDIVVARRAPDAPSGETTAVRLLGLLPPHWDCVPVVEQDRVVLRVRLDGAGGGETVRRAVEAVMADTALRGWRAEP